MHCHFLGIGYINEAKQLVAKQASDVNLYGMATKEIKKKLNSVTKQNVSIRVKILEGLQIRKINVKSEKQN